MSLTKVVLSGKASQMLNFCLPGRYVLLGVGKVLPWVVEGTPPDIDIDLYDVPGLSFYIPVYLTYGLIDDEEGDIVLPNGNSYTLNTVLSPAEVVTSNAFNLLIEANIPHNDLPIGITSYRAFGLYTNCILSDVSLLNNPIINLGQVLNRTLDSLVYFPPVTKQPNFIHEVKIIRDFLND
jgi:hypothetical protein